MTAKIKDQDYWFNQLMLLSKLYSDDPHEQALYAQGLMTAWLSRLAVTDWSIQREIEDRKQQKGLK